jgi:uncharacterized protein YbjT (DUF2867 family)
MVDTRWVAVDMILVVGGTGDLGGRVVRILGAGGHQLRCLVRPSTDESLLSELGVEVARGDLTDASSLAAACQGVTTVVATATVVARRLAGAAHPTIGEADQRGMASLVAAAEVAAVERFVYVSFPGAGQAGTALERAKTATEVRLRGSSLRSVIIRSDAFQEIHLAPVARFDIAQGKVSIIGKGDTKRRWIATEDVAALVAAVAVEPDPPEVITVGGPEALTKHEAVSLVERETGRHMKVQHMPRSVARLATRVLNRRNDALSSVFGAGLDQDLHAAVWDDQPLLSRGITPRPASDFLREQARQLSPH